MILWNFIKRVKFWFYFIIFIIFSYNTQLVFYAKKATKKKKKLILISKIEYFQTLFFMPNKNHKINVGAFLPILKFRNLK